MPKKGRFMLTCTCNIVFQLNEPIAVCWCRDILQWFTRNSIGGVDESNNTHLHHEATFLHKRNCESKMKSSVTL